MINGGIIAPSVASGADVTAYGTVQQHPLGTIFMTRDGRVFRYAQAGAAALVVGNITQGAVPIPDHLANTPPAVALGVNSFVYTPGATAGAANLYGEGYMAVDTTPGNGYVYQVSGHPAIVASTAFLLTLEDAIREVALTTSSRVGLHHNPFKNVIKAPTTVTARVAGGVVSPVPISNYGWLQTRGPFAALINGTPAVGTGLVVSATTTGALDVAGAVALEINYRIVAHAMQVGVSGKNNLVYLMLD